MGQLSLDIGTMSLDIQVQAILLEHCLTPSLAAARKALAEAEALKLANLEKKGFRITLKKIL